MRLSQAAIVGALVSLALVPAACGTDGGSAAGGAENAAAGAGESARPGTGRRSSCTRQLRPLLASLDALREDLAVGLSYDGYMQELRRVRGAYKRVRADRLELGCLVAAGAPAERALNRYTAAANAWGECLATAACEVESIEADLQNRWARASGLLSTAQAGL